MPEYQYQGRNTQGQALTGIRLATTADELANVLISEKITPVQIVEHTKVVSWQESLATLFKKKISLPDLIMFCRQMHTLVKAGIPITIAVSRLAETAPNASLSTALNGVVDRVSAGQALSVAMQQFPRVFSSLMISVIKVGENTGNLDDAFLQLSHYLELEFDTLKRFKAAVRYPLIVVSAVIAALVIINLFVIPVFADLFRDMGSTLPVMTHILIMVSDAIINFWPYLLSSALMLTLGVKYYLLTGIGRLSWDKAQLKLPIVGAIFNRILLSRFSRSFAIIIRRGVPLTDGIGLVARAMGNKHMENKILSMRSAIVRGETLTQAAAQTKLFSPLILQMLVVGEETGAVDTMLSEVAGFYEREVDYEIKRINESLEPILLVFIAAMVLTLALGVFLPMWNMVGLAQG